MKNCRAFLSGQSRLPEIGILLPEGNFRASAAGKNLGMQGFPEVKKTPEFLP